MKAGMTLTLSTSLSLTLFTHLTYHRPLNPRDALQPPSIPTPNLHAPNRLTRATLYTSERLAFTPRCSAHVVPSRSANPSTTVSPPSRVRVARRAVVVGRAHLRGDACQAANAGVATIRFAGQGDGMGPEVRLHNSAGSSSLPPWTSRSRINIRTESGAECNSHVASIWFCFLSNLSLSIPFERRPRRKIH